MLARLPPWRPLKGPQRRAQRSKADVVGYGGAAGGGKTDLACGLSITEHQKVGIFRRNGTELTAIIDRLIELIGRAGYNGQDKIWRTTRYDGKPLQIELGSFPNAGDEAKYRGRPHDLLVFDEAAEMRRSQVEFLMGWLRTVDPTQRCRVLMCFNPPTSVEGRWVIDYFAPWLDRKHPDYPAPPGELRWFAMVPQEDGRVVEEEVEDGEPFEVEMPNGKIELVEPSSRTFFPARIHDNPHLYNTGYQRRIMAMPEPLRSQLLYGDFAAGVEDDVWQVIPTRWVEAAMDRWQRPAKREPMDSVGVDVAMRGTDFTEIARRHGMWFDAAVSYPGAQCEDGATVAGFVVAARRDQAPVHIDSFGVGAKAATVLAANGVDVICNNVGDAARGASESGMLFADQRSELWWRMREALDPVNDSGICLPPDRQLLNDLCTPKWEVRSNRIKVQSRDKIIEKLGRSPDRGTAYVLALQDTPKSSTLRESLSPVSREYNPYRQF